MRSMYCIEPLGRYIQSIWLGGQVASPRDKKGYPGMSRLRETLRIGISLKRQLWIGALGDQLSMWLNLELISFGFHLQPTLTCLGKKAMLLLLLYSKVNALILTICCIISFEYCQIGHSFMLLLWSQLSLFYLLLLQELSIQLIFDIYIMAQ